MKIPRLASIARVGFVAAFTLGLAVAFWACSNEETALTPSDSPLAELSARAPEFAQAIGVHNRAIPEILADSKVAGTAVGADEHGKPVIMIYTKESVPPGHLKQDYEGFRVVQHVTGPIKPMKGKPGGGGSGTAKQTPPVKMGTSGGWRYDLANGYCCGGTLGSLVQIGGTKFVLSNYHVLYSDIVNGGNSRTAQPGDPVIQPGLIDVSCNANNAQNVATLVNGGGTLPDPGNPDAVDAGVAQVTSGMVDETGAILNVGTISSSTLNASVGLAVKKMGRTTGLTRSTVSAINGAFSITYGNECAGGTSFTQSYSGQIVIANSSCRFQNGGDSGSLLLEDVTTNPRAVGLCFAGSSVCTSGSIAIANPIGDVLNGLGATMVGQ
ncbi:MAG TPA: hypothetical protein VFP10_13305 [Candidatus Eisenbacteria bacterium]|nr:hypothetical protein [Candidatus Eisenbacteria bacterium]